MSLRYSLVVFDWDGTLVDSVGHIVDSLQYAANAMLLPERSSSSMASVIGLGMTEAVLHLYPELEMPEVTAFKDAYSEAFFRKPTDSSDIFEGVHEVLERLRSDGAVLAIATGKSRHGLDKALEGTGLGQYFTLTRCASETRSKPHPQMLHEIVSEMQSSPEQVLMVGDSVFDMEMARNAGVARVGVSYGVADESELYAYQPVAVISEMQSLLKFL